MLNPMDASVLLFETRAGRLTTPDGAWLCGARLTVEGAYRLFGVAPRELANTIVDLDALHGAAARALVDAIRNASTADRRLTLLGAYIAERAARSCKWHGAVEWALERIATTRGCVCVISLAREIGWSREHLHRRFVNQVGLGPKTCAQLARFHASKS